MFLEIKNRIEKELSIYIRGIDKAYSLSRISPVLFRSIKEFISRKGKRVRPMLFVVGYLGFAKKPAPGLYRSAISLELLHDFMLVHDDIIDKSDTRRGKPSMHAMLNKYIEGRKNIKFSGQDLTIVIGDVMFAMAMHSFLSIKENPRRKEASLRKLIEAAFYTGSGEFIELLYGIKDMEEIKKSDIYKIYDLKTANYTFASPLVMGAVLAGASKKETDKLFDFGIALGRAFQIKDDIIGLFSEEAQIGKSNLTDLQEAKKTILVWRAYQRSNKKNRSAIKNILKKELIGKADLVKMREIVSESGALDYAKKEVSVLIKQAEYSIEASKMRPLYKNRLNEYSRKLLTLA